MKATGVVRKIDELGRVVLPIELRRTLDIRIHDPLEIYTSGDSIILRKYEVRCVFCGEDEDVSYFRGKAICQACRKDLLAAAASDRWESGSRENGPRGGGQRENRPGESEKR